MIEKINIWGKGLQGGRGFPGPAEVDGFLCFYSTGSLRKSTITGNGAHFSSCSVKTVLVLFTMPRVVPHELWRGGGEVDSCVPDSYRPGS